MAETMNEEIDPLADAKEICGQIARLREGASHQPSMVMAAYLLDMALIEATAQALRTRCRSCQAAQSIACAI
ncbi:hypothetical protein [Methyloraptor flagellatus]|uniref:Uncharacterized protein n=1 Tax=Methyloraptor flagellatus TaxID=3162530 RepID=A0AAU7X9T2_9HYPH